MQTSLLTSVCRLSSVLLCSFCFATLSPFLLLLVLSTNALCLHLLGVPNRDHLFQQYISRVPRRLTETCFCIRCLGDIFNSSSVVAETGLPARWITMEVSLRLRYSGVQASCPNIIYFIHVCIINYCILNLNGFMKRTNRRYRWTNYCHCDELTDAHNVGCLIFRWIDEWRDRLLDE